MYRKRRNRVRITEQQAHLRSVKVCRNVALVFHEMRRLCGSTNSGTFCGQLPGTLRLVGYVFDGSQLLMDWRRQTDSHVSNEFKYWWRAFIKKVR